MWRRTLSNNLAANSALPAPYALGLHRSVCCRCKRCRAAVQRAALVLCCGPGDAPPASCHSRVAQQFQPSPAFLGQCFAALLQVGRSGSNGCRTQLSAVQPRLRATRARRQDRRSQRVAEDPCARCVLPATNPTYQGGVHSRRLKGRQDQPDRCAKLHSLRKSSCS
jgi:hypothetical protein